MVSSRGHVINGQVPEQFLIAYTLSALGSLYYQRLTGKALGKRVVGRRFVVQSSIINNFVGQVSAIRSALSTCSFFFTL